MDFAHAPVIDLYRYYKRPETNNLVGLSNIFVIPTTFGRLPFRPLNKWSG